MTELDRVANVLGALAGTVTDQTVAAMSLAAGRATRGSTTALAALSAMAEFLDSPTVDGVRQVLGLTPSGAVRLIDRLAADGLVVRGPGADGRSRSVRLTAAGRTAADDLARARRAVLVTMLSGFSPDELAAMEGLLARLMRNAVYAKTGGPWICRLCDLTACDRAGGHCPAHTAALARFKPDHDPHHDADAGADPGGDPGGADAQRG